MSGQPYDVIVIGLGGMGTTRHPIDLFSPARFAGSRDYTEVTRD